MVVLVNNSDPIPLDRLGPRQCAIVHHVEAGDDDLARLMAMGLCRNRSVELIHAGDPMILRVFGSRIGISARLASRIIVNPCDPAACDCR